MRRDYYENWEKRTLEEILIEIDNERQILQEIIDDEPYEEQSDQIEATRENISMLQQIAGEKSRGRENATSTPEARLAKLQELFNKGLISKEEYANTRTSILKSI